MSNIPEITSSLSTGLTFDLLHEKNVKYGANIRGEVNQRYNQLLSEAKSLAKAQNQAIWAEEIPGGNLHELGMEQQTSLIEELYWKALSDIIAPYKIPSLRSRCGVVQGSLFKNIPCELFPHITWFLEARDISCCESVCKDWNEKINHESNPIWESAFIREGIPRVEKSVEKQDYKFELKTLTPITIGARQLSFLGEVVGEIPRIHRKIFDKLFDADPLEPGKLMKETFLFMVDPDAFSRKSSKEFPYDVDENGNLQERDKSKDDIKEVVIPNTVNNLHILCKYPLGKVKKNPAFRCADNILAKFSTCQNGVQILFMRKSMPSDGKTYYDARRDFAWFNGSFDPTPLKPRVIFNAFCAAILGTSPDHERGSTCLVGTSDVVTNVANCQRVVIGCLPGAAVVGSGKTLCSFSIGLSGQLMRPSHNMGVIPSFWAELSAPLTFGHDD